VISMFEGNRPGRFSRPGRRASMAGAVAGGTPNVASRDRGLIESLVLILRDRSERIVSVAALLAVALMTGMFLQEVLYKFGDLGALTIIAIGIFGLIALGVALAFPSLSVVACVAVAFSSSSSVLHDKYGLPVLTKYLPMVLIATIVIIWVRQSRTRFIPERFWLPVTRDSEFPVPFCVCMSLLALFYAFTLIPALYATDATLALDELGLQQRNLIICLALALTVGRFGVLTSLPNVCVLAMVGTTGAVLLAILGSFFPGLESILPGFTQVYSGNEADDVTDRIAGTFGHPNSLGRYAVFMIPLTVALILTGEARVRRLAYACVLVLLAGVMLSESRGALLVLLAIAVPAFALSAKRIPIWYQLGALCVATIVILAAGQYVDTERMVRSIDDAGRMLGDGAAPVDGATRGRLAEMRVAFELWQSRPLTGVGLANYEHYFQMYSYDFGTKLYNDDRSAHSMYLELLAERGIIGLGVFLIAIGGVVLTVLLQGIRRLRNHDRSGGYLTVAMVVSALAYYLSAVILHDVHAQPIWALLGVMIAATRLPVAHATLAMVIDPTVAGAQENDR